MPTVIVFGVAHVGVEYLFRLFFVLPLAHFSPQLLYQLIHPPITHFVDKWDSMGGGRGKERQNGGEEGFLF